MPTFKSAFELFVVPWSCYFEAVLELADSDRCQSFKLEIAPDECFCIVGEFAGENTFKFDETDFASVEVLFSECLVFLLDEFVSNGLKLFHPFCVSFFLVCGKFFKILSFFFEHSDEPLIVKNHGLDGGAFF